GPRRHLHDAVLSVGAGTVLPGAIDAALALEVLLVAVVDQRVEIVDAENDDIAPVTAVAAVGSAELDELLGPEADASVAAVARFDIDLCKVEKFHAVSLHSMAVIGRLSS